jgi:hypothetical protein
MPREPAWYFFDITRNKLHLRDRAEGSNAKTAHLVLISMLLETSPTSVADPGPDPDSYVFGPPGYGSGSISTSYEVWIRILL